MVGAALVLALSATAVTVGVARPPGQPRLTVAGVAQDPCQPRALPVPARLNGRFEPDSSILLKAGEAYVAPGRLAPLTWARSACAAAAEQAGRDWLRAGLVPGATTAQRSMATRALLDLRLAVRPDGAVLAGWRSGWAYVWPRDASWVAAALTETGHPAMAYQILRFLQRMQPAELDADGWVTAQVQTAHGTQPSASSSAGRPSRTGPEPSGRDLAAQRPSAGCMRCRKRRIW